MVTRLLKHSLLFSIMLSLNACSDDDGIDIIDIKVPEGYALSADISTIFLNSSTAYDVEANWVAGKYLTRFNSGNKLYDNAFQAERTLRLAALVRSMRVSPVAAAT